MSAKKAKILKVFAITGLLLALLFVISLVLEGIVNKNSETELDYEFYTPTEEEDYFNDPDYLKKDRTLHYTDSMGQGWFIDDNSSCGDIGAVFFRLYFLALEQGDADAFNDMYKKELGTYTAFTPQRVYSKELVYLTDGKIDDDTFFITYSLDYNIMKNDGSFRRDIGSDMSRTQYITLYYTAEDAWIEEVKTEYRK